MGEVLIFLASLFGLVVFVGSHFVLRQVVRERRMVSGMLNQIREHRRDCQRLAQDAKDSRLIAADPLDLRREI